MEKFFFPMAAIGGKKEMRLVLALCTRKRRFRWWKNTRMMKSSSIENSETTDTCLGRPSGWNLHDGQRSRSLSLRHWISAIRRDSMRARALEELALTYLWSHRFWGSPSVIWFGSSLHFFFSPLIGNAESWGLPASTFAWNFHIAFVIQANNNSSSWHHRYQNESVHCWAIWWLFLSDILCIRT